MSEREKIKKKMALIRGCIGRRSWLCGTWCVHCLTYRTYEQDLCYHDGEKQK